MVQQTLWRKRNTIISKEYLNMAAGACLGEVPLLNCTRSGNCRFELSPAILIRALAVNVEEGCNTCLGEKYTEDFSTNFGFLGCSMR